MSQLLKSTTLSTGKYVSTSHESADVLTTSQPVTTGMGGSREDQWVDRFLLCTSLEVLDHQSSRVEYKWLVMSALTQSNCQA